MPVKRSIIYIPLVCVISWSLSRTPAGVHTHLGNVTTINRAPFAPAAGHKSPQPDTRAHLTQGKQLQLIPKLEVSSKAILTTDWIAPEIVTICLQGDPLVSQFTQGVYLRFRPRDPPLA